jgi:hypothetical protein
MKILVAIANYGTGNQDYLSRLIAEYRSMPWKIDIVILSNIPKEAAPGVEVLVGLPDPKDPWSLPFLHRRLFAERLDRYDLFIYSEDDTLVRASNIEAFLQANRLLRPDEIPGFMRTETDEAGNAYVSSIHHFFRWDTSRVIDRGGEIFAAFTNDHAACYMATRDHLAAAISSGGFLVAPHQGRYDMLCAAATDIYTRCGLKRYIPIERLRDFLLPHLPNKYIGDMGIPLAEVEAQVGALRRIAGFGGWRGPLVQVETRLPHAKWSKNLYESPQTHLMEMVPGQTKRLLSVGCGWGATEAALAERKIEVTALPVDPVFGDAVRRRGVQTLEGSLGDVVCRLNGCNFDCVLLPDILHLLPDPLRWLSRLRPLLEPEKGALVLSVPYTSNLLSLWKMRGGLPVIRRQAFKATGVQPVSRRLLKNWLGSAGFRVDSIVPVVTGRRARAAAASFGVLQPYLAHGFLVRAHVAPQRLNLPGFSS